MPLILIWIIVFAAVLIIFKFFPSLTRGFTLTIIGEKGKLEVGAKAMAMQPDRITLTPAEPPVGAAATLVARLVEAGFRPAGDYSVTEMAGLKIHFTNKPDESVMAAVYEHPRAGVWFDMFTRYADGTSYTIATTRAGGNLDPRPGHPVVRVPGMDPSAARAQFLRDRPRAAMKTFSNLEMPGMYAAAYAESMAWRKQHGISAAEVQKVGMEKFKG